MSNSGNKSQEKKVGFTIIEERDKEGRLIFPRKVIKSTEYTFYNPEEHKDLKIMIWADYAPAGAMFVSRKIYDIQELTIRGWKAKAEVVIELSPQRGHEKAWFDAFEGVDADIDPAPKDANILNKFTEYNMKVIKTSFAKKVKTIGDTDNRMFEARIFMKETYRSAYVRNKNKIFENLIWIIIGAIICAIIGSLITLWITNFFGD